MAAVSAAPGADKYRRATGGGVTAPISATRLAALPRDQVSSITCCVGAFVIETRFQFYVFYIGTAVLFAMTAYAAIKTILF
jgi:hypothetical protein